MTDGSGLLVEIRNRADILRVYGAEFAASMEGEIGARARELWGAQTQVRFIPQGYFLITWKDVVTLDQSRASRAGRAESLLATLSERVKQQPGTGWLAKLGAEWVSGDAPLVARSLSCTGGLVDEGSYDMRISEMVSDAICDSRISITTQPICNVDQSDLVLYRECLTTLQDRDGHTVFPDIFIPSLERTGLIRWFDRYVVRQVIGLLRNHADLSLGINISALSVDDNVLWESTLIDLLKAPDVARRLVFEISESASLSRGRGRLFANRLKQLGCRIAIDDFGVRYGVETGIEIESPDVVKIDPSFLCGSDKGSANASRLARIVALAADTAPLVVVGGVASQEDLCRVRGASAVWAQGFYYESRCGAFD